MKKLTNTSKSLIAKSLNEGEVKHLRALVAKFLNVLITLSKQPCIGRYLMTVASIISMAQIHDISKNVLVNLLLLLLLPAGSCLGCHLDE